MKPVLNLFVLALIGGMLANAIAHAEGTKALFNGVSGLWQIGMNGVLGQTTNASK